MASPHKSSLDPEKLLRIRPSSIEGRFFRLVPEKYQAEALSIAGSLQYGGRYNPPREFGALYLGEDEGVCWAEIRRRAGSPEFLREPRVLAEVEVELERVLDLADEEVLRELGIEEDDLLKATGDEVEDYHLTRELARLAREGRRASRPSRCDRSPVEGIISSSLQIGSRSSQRSSCAS